MLIYRKMEGIRKPHILWRDVRSCIEENSDERKMIYEVD